MTVGADKKAVAGSAEGRPPRPTGGSDKNPTPWVGSNIKIPLNTFPTSSLTEGAG